MNQITHVTKSAFAEMCGRTPAAVTHWINGGILKDSLEEVDGVEMVRLPDAHAEVARKLDPSQQFSQTQPITAKANDADDRYLEAKAREKELDVELAERKLKAQAGAWLETEKARREWGRAAATIFSDHEAWLSELSAALAGEFGLEAKAVTVAVRKSYRAFRERKAAEMKDAARPA